MKPFTERNPLVMGAIGLGLTAVIVVGALQYDKIPFINQNKGLLGLLRRGRWADNRCPRAGFGFPGG